MYILHTHVSDLVLLFPEYYKVSAHYVASYLCILFESRNFDEALAILLQLYL